MCVGVYVYHSLSLLYLFTLNGHLGCFHILAVVNMLPRTMNVKVHTSFWVTIFVFFE